MSTVRGYSCKALVKNHLTQKGIQPIRLNPSLLLVPGTRIELVQAQGPRDFKSLASTSSATQASCFFSDSIISLPKMQIRLTLIVVFEIFFTIPSKCLVQMDVSMDNFALSLPL